MTEGTLTALKALISPIATLAPDSYWKSTDSKLAGYSRLESTLKTGENGRKTHSTQTVTMLVATVRVDSMLESELNAGGHT